MSIVQLLALLVFFGLLVVMYGKRVVAMFKRAPTSTDTSPAVTLVSELVNISKLRDKLAAENCQPGVEACTALLRVIVEQQPKNGAA
jgi:hypothetical protein